MLAGLVWRYEEGEKCEKEKEKEKKNEGGDGGCEGEGECEGEGDESESENEREDLVGGEKYWLLRLPVKRVRMRTCWLE
jgi:hypothetical protein